MVMKADKQRLRKVLLDAISLLCRNSLPVSSQFCIEATIGITLNEDDVVLVSFKETIEADEGLVPQATTPAETRLPPFKEIPLNRRNDVCNDTQMELTNGIDDIGHENHGQLAQTNDMKPQHNNTTTVAHKQKSGRSRKRVYNRPEQETSLAVCGAQDHMSVENWSSDGAGERHARRTRDTRQRAPTSSALVVKKEVVQDEFEEQEQGEEDYVACDGEPKRERGSGGPLNWGGSDDGTAQRENNGWMFREVYDSSVPNAAAWPEDIANIANQGCESTDGMENEGEGGTRAWGPRSEEWLDEGCGGVGTGTSGRRHTIAAGLRGGGGSQVNQGAIMSRALQALRGASAADQSAGADAAVFCQICGARLANSATLIKHIKGTHLAMSMCQCEICGEQFKWTMQLCRHRKRYHANDATVLGGDMVGAGATELSSQIVLQ